MGQYEDLKLFLTVVERGSISKAAGALNIAKSAVSRRLGQLEERYGSVLVDRSPGQWALTETGRELYQRAMPLVEDLEDMDGDFTSAVADVSGPLRVSVPLEYGLAHLQEALLGFVERHPEILLTVDYEDRFVDLARENYDFVIRIGRELQGEAVVQLGTVEHGAYASPAYLEEMGRPERLAELEAHRLLHYGVARRAEWALTRAGGEEESVSFQPYVNSNSGVFLRDAAIKGRGICLLPDFVVGEAEREGALVRILEAYEMPQAQIALMHAEDRRLNRRMRVFSKEIAAACEA